MRIDHIAYRVKDRKKTSKFFIDALGYKIQTEFDLKFPDGTTTDCIALEPPEKEPRDKFAKESEFADKIIPWQIYDPEWNAYQYHLAPEIFVSDGQPESIVGKWVAERNGIGGIHHIAYMVDNVENTMKEWIEKGYAEFTSSTPMKCPGLTQIFTKPSELTGVIYEFIEREEFGFCKENVKDLMLSTIDFK